MLWRDTIERRWNCPFFGFEDVDALTKSENRINSVIGINLGRATYLAYHRPKPSRNLIVFFSGAFARGPNRKPPYFSGLDMTEGLNTSFLAIDDPALQYSDEISIGWHLGTSDFSLMTTTVGVIEHIATINGADHIILAGGSAGGFASLFYGSLVKSTIISVNPQTDITKYYRSHYNRYVRTCFRGNAGSPLVNTNLATHFKASGSTPRGTVLQNLTDWHTENHAIPLKKAMGGRPNSTDETIDGLSFVFRDWGEGHAPLPKEKWTEILAASISGQEPVDAINSLMSESTRGATA